VLEREVDALGTRTLHAPWRLVRSGTTVVGADAAEHTIESVRRDGALVRVRFEDGRREMHHEGAEATVVLRVATSRSRDASERPNPVPALITQLLRSRDRRELEALADDLAATGAREAVHPLVVRLTGSFVQDDPDLECAVCDALVALGAMRWFGNLRYAFRPDHELCDEARRALSELRPFLPARYLGAQ
jgi:hypothetical protein